MKRLCYILILLSMISCYSVKNGKPIPWFDNYKLKNKNTVIPKSLDTNNIYMLKESYGDIYNIKWLRIYTNSKRATFYIYLPKNELYLKYDENTTIDEFNKLLKEFNITPKDVK